MMRGLLLVALLTSGCALHQPLVHPGDQIVVVWGMNAQGAVIHESFTVDAVLGDGWILARNPGAPRPWKVNLRQAWEFAIAAPSTPAAPEVREQARR